LLKFKGHNTLIPGPEEVYTAENKKFRRIRKNQLDATGIDVYSH